MKESWFKAFLKNFVTAVLAVIGALVMMAVVMGLLVVGFWLSEVAGLAVALGAVLVVVCIAAAATITFYVERK